MATRTEEDLPPQKVAYLRETEAPSEPERFSTTYAENVPIAFDFGSANVRAGLTNSPDPHNVFPCLVAKYRDRKSGRTLTIIGNDVHREAPYHATLRSSSKSPFDGPLITNWDYVESIFDYLLEHLGVTSDNGKLNNPVILTEPVGCPSTQRKGMYEIMFEAYQAPKVAIGIDSLFSYYNSNAAGKSGMVISAGNELTHIIPVVDGKGILLNSKRIDWGGNPGLDYLQKLLALKYPYFPQRLTNGHCTSILQDHAYVLQDYASELATYLEMDNLEKNDVVLQMPVELAPEKAKKSDEELARQAEKRREHGRRLQEQAAAKRIENLKKKEEEHAYYMKIKEELLSLSKDEAERRVQAADFEDVRDLSKYIELLLRLIKHARSQAGIEAEEEEEIDPVTAWPLAEVPDVELTEEQIKEKRRQKLVKINYMARIKAKEDRQRAQAEEAQYEKEQEDWRLRDLGDWCSSKRLEVAQHIAEYKKRAKHIVAMKDRKSMAAQQRMKALATMANDGGGAARKRKRNVTASTIDNDPNDTFGADDSDWNAYRDVSTEALEDEQSETMSEILKLEEQLLEHDPNFHHEDTFAVAESFDWRNSTLHKFIYGPRPNLTIAMQAEGHDPDELINHPEIIKQNHQLHVNIERIRVPEIYFQPHMAGLDLAGIPEVVHNLLFRNFDGNLSPGGTLRAMLENIFVTGGGSLVPNFCDRLRAEIKAFLPTDSPLNVTHTAAPIIDPWRGMSKWANSEESKNCYVSKAEYEEFGAEYIKEHGLGNVNLMRF